MQQVYALGDLAMGGNVIDSAIKNVGARSLRAQSPVKMCPCAGLGEVQGSITSASVFLSMLVVFAGVYALRSMRIL